MHPMVEKHFGSLVRYLVGVVAGWAAANGISDWDAAANYLTSAALTGLTTLWIWKKNRKEQSKLLVAAAAETKVTEDEVEGKLAAGVKVNLATPKSARPEITVPSK